MSVKLLDAFEDNYYLEDAPDIIENYISEGIFYQLITYCTCNNKIVHAVVKLTIIHFIPGE